MLVKAVANSTSASFIRVVGSEFVQKYLGEVSSFFFLLFGFASLFIIILARIQGPRMVRDVFRLARENAPAIIFIDEVDAIATKRFDAQTGADREVQRILLELLNQMDGFDQGSNVKVRSLERVLWVEHRTNAIAVKRRLSWPPTGRTPWTRHCFDPVDWIGRSSSLTRLGERRG